MLRRLPNNLVYRDSFTDQNSVYKVEPTTTTSVYDSDSEYIPDGSAVNENYFVSNQFGDSTF